MRSKNPKPLLEIAGLLEKPSLCMEKPLPNKRMKMRTTQKCRTYQTKQSLGLRRLSGPCNPNP